MHFPSIFLISTSLLAAQVPAQFIRSVAPNNPAWSTPASSMATPSSSSPIAQAMNSNLSFYKVHYPFRPHAHDVPMHSSTRSDATPSSSFSMIPSTTPSTPAYDFGSSSQDQEQDPDHSMGQGLGQDQDFRRPMVRNSADVYAVPHGGLAPVDPLQPGSNVAPVLIQKPSGVDEGNSFCLGQCYAKKEEAHCAEPYASALYKSSNDCWMCCFTPGAF